jgi:hypothetical protein
MLLLMKKFLAIMLLSLLFGGSAFAECIKGDCKNGYGEYMFSNGKYSGNWIKGKRTGQGKYEWHSGDFYEGGFRKGKLHGYGKLKFKEGDFEEGEWHKGKPKSLKVTWSNGDYCSDWGRNGCRVEIVKKNNTFSSNSMDIASLIDQAKDTCKSLGFKDGTEKFTDCSLKLYSQSLDLAAKQNQQVVIQNQGSSSGTVKMFDVVRDRENTMRKAKGLIDGSCTLANYVFC